MRFEIVAELGRGSTGIVYKAIDRETRDIVAVKQLLPGTIAPQRELLLARKVTHRNVCRVNDLHREDGNVFISMEFVDGGCLKGPLPRSKAIPIAKQICEGLGAAHREGVVHGDLKPGNILITTRGAVKLTDFGLARSMDPEATAGRGIAGTPAYMAPELFAGEEPSVRSDIYALGFVLKEMGLGGPVVSRCLEREPANRFASAAELQDALDSPAARFRPVPRMAHRFLVASLAVVVAAAVFLAWSSSETVPRRHAAATRIPSKPSVAVLFDEEALIPVLIHGGKFRVVERAELDKVLTELKLNRGEAFDPATAQRVGKLVGAEYLLLGGKQAPGKDAPLNARLVRTETGDIVASETGKEGELAELAEKLAERVEKF